MKVVETDRSVTFTWEDDEERSYILFQAMLLRSFTGTKTGKTEERILPKHS
jgi:hypothetical protein